MEQKQNMKEEDFFSNILFVSDLPKETKNKDIKNFFKNYKFLKASLNISKMNNIFAQVIVENGEMADKARHELNGLCLIPESEDGNEKYEGRPIRICKYRTKFNIKGNKTDLKRSLLIKNVDIQMNQHEFYNIFLKYGDIFSAKIEYDKAGKSKGYGFVDYFNESSAETAKTELNGKEYYGKKLEIVNFIPSNFKKKSKDLTLFITNLPSNVTKKEINSIFGKYGKIINIKLTKKGFGYITYSEMESITKCLSDIKNNPISFLGLPEVLVKFATSKEERENNKIINNKESTVDEDSLKINFELINDDNNEINNEIELEKSIRLFVKIIFITEYFPKSVEINYNTRSGLITFNQLKDCNLFLEKYLEYCKENKPMFYCSPFKQEKQKNYNFNSYIYNNSSSDSLNIDQNSKNNLSGLSNNSKSNSDNNIIKTNQAFSIDALNDKKTKDNSLFSKDSQLNEIFNKQSQSCHQFNLFPNKNYFMNLQYNNNHFYKNKEIILNNLNYPINNNLNKNINFNNNYFNNNLINNDFNLNQMKYNHYKISLNNTGQNEAQKLQNNYEQLLTNLCDSIYKTINNKYPNEAGKITGMIRDLGLEKMISLISNQKNLDKVIEKAHNMILKKTKNETNG